MQKKNGLGIFGQLSLLLVPLFIFSGCNSGGGGGVAAIIPIPIIVSTVPANSATGVPTNRGLTATFSMELDPSSITTTSFVVTQGGAPVFGTVSSIGSTAIFRPTTAFSVSTAITATLTTAAKSVAGKALAANSSWSFTTGATTDTTAPTVSSTFPLDSASAVPLNRTVVATFSEALDPVTITSSTFTVTQSGSAVAGTVSVAGANALFMPTNNLGSNLNYVATITTGVKDLAGNTLATNKIWSFTTGSSVATGPAAVNLATAADFVILAKSGIDTVPTSAVTGDMGVSPIDSTAVTGFSLSLHSSGVYSTSPQVSGNIYAANYTVPAPSKMTTAIADMQTAYTDASGRTTPDFTELGAGDISGMTLTPGLYKWGTGLAINSNVTLSGSPNDIWIFQIAGGLTQANGTQITLIGGALAKNIFWQSFGSVSIGTTSHFEGNILSQTSIALNTGASINGRLLAQTAVTLKSSTVSKPAP